MAHSAEKGFLGPREAAYVLEVTPRAVQNMLRRGELVATGAGRLRRVDPDQIAKRVADRPLALAALRSILGGRLCVPHVPLDGPTASLIESWDWLW